MNRTEGRIAVSRNVGDVLGLADSVFQKHTADGTASPLLNLDGISWGVVGPTIATALAKHREAKRLKG